MNDCALERYADGIDETVIEKYLCYEEKIKTHAKFFSFRNLKIAAVAACIGIFLLSGIFSWVLPLLETTPSDNGPYFMLQAYAQNGELKELNLFEGTLNSGSANSETNIFGVDQPIFDFCILLTDGTGKRLSVFDVDVSIYYNEREADLTNDKHIVVSYMMPLKGNKEPSGYCVSGWFEEPTDIIIKISDKKTGVMLESYTLNVCYFSDREEYLLTLIEANPNCTAETETINISSMLTEINAKEISVVYGRSGIKAPHTIYDENEINEIIDLFLDNVSVSSDEKVVSDFSKYCFGAYPDSYLMVTFVSESGGEICFIIYEKTKMMILLDDQTVYVCNTSYSEDYELLKENLN